MNKQQFSKIDSPKFQQLVSTANDLFIRYGIRRVTIEEICKTASVSKMTFYKFFQNKNDLAKYLLRIQMNEGEALFDEIMSKNIPFRKKADELLKMKMEKLHEMSPEYLNEILGAVPEIKNYYVEQANITQKRIIEAFMHAQEKGEIRKDLNPEFHIFMLNHILELLDDDRLKKIFQDPIELSRELIQFYFFGITARGNK
jgi:AcrR family transcriptional regulator